MKKWYVLLLLAGWCTALTAQVKIKEDPLITRMVETYINGNKAKASVEGWRVQLLATTDRQRLESVKQSFQYRYPRLSAPAVMQGDALLPTLSSLRKISSALTPSWFVAAILPHLVQRFRKLDEREAPVNGAHHDLWRHSR